MSLPRIISFMAAACLVTFVSGAALELRWTTLPPLPPSAGQAVQPGVAAPFVGTHGGVLLVGGGANFPDRMPWDGGAKVWWDDLWVLETQRGAGPRWVADKTFKLPRPLGYGISVSTPEGVICAGGHDAERAYADVFMLSWDPRAREIRRTELPPLPRPLTFMAGALAGNVLYVAGGQHAMKDAQPTSAFWALDLAKRDRPGEFKWMELPPWPGPARVLPVAAAQRTQAGETFFLFSGRVPRTGRPTEILRDAYAFTPATRTWRKVANVGGGAGVSVMGGSAVTTDAGEILVFGGDRGELFLELEGHDLALAATRQKVSNASAAGRATFEREIDERLRAKTKIYATHPGFSRDVLAYDPRRDAWRTIARSPKPLPVTTTAVRWGDAIVLPSGEIRPGVRTDEIIRVNTAR